MLAPAQRGTELDERPSVLKSCLRRLEDRHGLPRELDPSLPVRPDGGVGGHPVAWARVGHPPPDETQEGPEHRPAPATDGTDLVADLERPVVLRVEHERREELRRRPARTATLAHEPPPAQRTVEISGDTRPPLAAQQRDVREKDCQG